MDLREKFILMPDKDIPYDNCLHTQIQETLYLYLYANFEKECKFFKYLNDLKFLDSQIFWIPNDFSFGFLMMMTRPRSFLKKAKILLSLMCSHT